MPELSDIRGSRRELLRRWAAGRAERSGIPRRPDPAAAVPLSAAQQRIWFLEQLFPGRATYTMPLALRLFGPLDVAAVRDALAVVVARHEALRTTIELRDGLPVQVVGEAGPVRFTVVEPEELDAERREADALDRVDRFCRTVFDLSGPLFEVLLVRLSEDEALFAIAMHHIVSDGWSLGVFATELMAAYGAGGAAALPELAVQYADYAEWLRTRAGRDEFDGDLDYWRDVLGDEPPLVTFHPDRPRALQPESRGARLTFTIPAEISTGLRRLAGEVRRNDRPATLFVALMAGFKALLRYYTGAEDITVGTPIANRTRPEVEPLIGFFVNALALRTDLSGAPTFRELLAREQGVIFDAFDHQEVPFDLVVEHVRPDRELSHSPLFRTALVLQNTALPELSVSGIRAEYLEVHSATAKFDVLVQLRPVGDEIVGAIEYDTDLYDEATAAGLARHFVALLGAAVARPDIPLPELDFLEDEERERAVAAALPGDDIDAPNATLHELFRAQAARTPDAVAVTFGDEHTSYGELASAAGDLARVLRGRGIGLGEFVGIHLERSADVVVAILAVLEAGAAYVPLDPMNPGERISFMISDSGARLVITQESLAGALGAEDGPELLLVDGEVPAKSTPGPDVESTPGPEVEGTPGPEVEGTPGPEVEGTAGSKAESTPGSEGESAAGSAEGGSSVGPQDPCYVIYTSGSTGVPKGVIIEHRNVVRLFSGTRRWFDFGAGDVWTMFHSYSFDFAVWEMWGALLHGGRVVVVPSEISRAAEDFAELVVREGVTVLNQTPSAFLQLVPALAGARGDGLALRWVVFGGEALDLPSLRPWFQRHGDRARLINMYGITETTVHVTYREVTAADVDSAAGSLIGVPLPDLGVLILDPAGRPVPDGVAGEMFVSGAGVGRGYLNRDELTAQRFVRHPLLGERRLYRTGDLARRRADGDLEYLGRIDHQVKVRGFRIELGEIEAVLDAHPGVEQSVVLAREDSGGTVALVAYFTPRDLSADEDAVAAEQDQVSDWEVVFDSTYGQHRDDIESDFNITGWNSSYTNAAIPDEHMREWVDSTVEAVRALRPRRVLEIGCGTGLLLSRLAPDTERYDATDMSSTALAHVRENIAAGLSQVRLFQGAADQLPEELIGPYDVILINSVVQYFPSADYLTRVLEEAADLLGPDGVLYVGDVRDLDLLRAFHTTVEMAAAPAAGAAELAPAVTAACDRDAELLLAPQYFADIAANHPNLSGARIRLRRGAHLNEMSRFRYDAVLYAGGPRRPVLARVLDPATSPAALADLLAREEPEAVVVPDVADARISGPLAVAAAVARGRANAAELRAALADSDGTNPEAYLALAERTPYRIEAIRRPDGRFDVIATRWDVPLAAAPARPVTWRGGPVTSDPLRVKARDDLAVAVRAHLARRLPQHMVPAGVMVLDRFPLTTNGKLDRRALPAPVLRRNPVSYEPPRTPLEQRISAVFAQVLGVPRVGREDNFFDLGGHSLLAAQLVLRLKETFDEDIPLGSLFARPTVEGVAALLSGDTAAGEVVDYEAEVRAITARWPAGPWPLPAHAPTGAVLLTGATGFVGAFLLRELLARTDLRVHCLVRADSRAAALRRLTAAFDDYELPHDGLDRVVPVLGDLAEPRLGLSEKEFLLLGRSVDAIYHNGAHVNFALPYRVLEAANITGTELLLDLARSAGVPLHFVSSLYVLGPGDGADGRVTEPAPPRDPSQLALGYLQTKWVAERLVCEAGERGLPVGVYRLGRIGGDSATGACQTSDFFWLLVKASQEVGLAPDVGFTVDLAPADFAAAAIVELARNTGPGTHIHHVRNQAPGAFADAVAWIREGGWEIRLAGIPEWRDAVAAHAATAGPESAAYRVLSLLGGGDGLAPALSFDVDPAIERAGVACPPVSRELFVRYLDYFRKIGFLAPPSRQEVGV
ncbi:non-ribosomal peptide synthetase [Nocardia terpenica]|uniref:Non-ribosomal peptide synthetase n=1 Tax=Nocardia terpenica TaxID=455432 RepID=A0A291RFP2_9NOCA|nr:non-ribosomal peptide synthetase [Nocardia terpenica]ATL66118.1 non-ribosomal peptide synthetase [Nocardia terpenica]